MKKNLFFRFFLGLICLLLLSSIIYITPVNASSQSVKFVEQIAQTPSLSKSESIKQLINTGKAKNGNFEGVDIIKTLEDAGVASFSDGDQIYFLNKFDALDLEGANLRNASLKFLSARKINLKNANLSWANISNVRWDEADFSRAEMYRTDFSRSYLRGANFEKSNSGGLELLGGDFSNANFKDSCMDGVDMRASIFTGANFENAVFDSDGPYDPYYLGANFTDANLRNLGKNFECGGGAAASYLKNDKSVYFCHTIMPDGTINNRDCKS